MGAQAPQPTPNQKRPQQGPQPPRQQMGPPPPPQQTNKPGGFKNFYANNKGSIGDALMAMGTSMMSQETSTMPTSFGQALGQGATAGIERFGESRKEKEAREERERIKKRQEILQKRDDERFKWESKDRLRQQKREDVSDERAAETFEQQKVTFGRSGTTYDQQNIMFDMNLEDLAEKRRRGEITWAQEQQDRNRIMDQYGRVDAARKAMQDVDLSGLNEEEQSILGAVSGVVSPEVWTQYAMGAAEDPEMVSMMTNDMKNAMFVARARNPNATQEDVEAFAAGVVSDKMSKPETQINLENTPGAKGNELYSQGVMEKAQSSEETYNLLSQFETGQEGVNVGFFADLIQDGATGFGQIAQTIGPLIGLEYTQDEIDAALKTDSGRAAVVEGIGNRLALEMTNQLAGQISEKELAFAIKSMPSLLNTAEGNKMLIAVLKGKAQLDMDRAMYVESLRDENGKLPGRIRHMTLKWNKENKLRVRDDEGRYTPYGQTLVDVGLFEPENYPGEDPATIGVPPGKYPGNKNPNYVPPAADDGWEDVD